jgi:hypothetical protein
MNPEIRTGLLIYGTLALGWVTWTAFVLVGGRV